MTNILKFPVKTDAAQQEAAPGRAPQLKPAKDKPRRNLFAPVLRFLWVVTVLVWPILKWVVSISVFFQFIRMVYHWDTPGVYAGWTFLAYFAAQVALTYFVSLYKPKGL